MRKLVYTTAFFLFGATALFANNTDSKLGLSSEKDYLFSKQDSIELVVDLGDLEGLSHAEITDKINSAMDILDEDALHCTVKVKGVIKIGGVSVEIEVTVSGPCAEVKKSGREIATEILEQVKFEISKLF